ncbi:[protein-PII] uridylyltransferase [Desulfogranum mediterraneum]|uniref:[protein-PII] uridylyltransferase n=1 Tax=Desulfogranum mediterraneum TaxID=160661 RepID=UPI0003F8C6A6|nr:[protein-PII] uridylyltransferase [Desulfogranum mediterraneum]
MERSLRFHQDGLEDLWQQGLSGHALLQRYTDLVDGFIADHLQQARDKVRPDGAIAVIALGGYGRSELYPYSDIDLLLLHDRAAAKSMAEVAEAILYPLWNEGLDVGHSVRTVKDAINFAGEDYIFQVALLDARLIGGSEELFAELQGRYTKKIFEGRRAAFVVSMEELRRQRRQKFGSHAYLLEPHIKEGKGGMRDIQAMLWVAKGVFGLTDLDAIASSAMISVQDRVSLEDSWDMLVKVRNRLHYLRRRKDDQLIFEYQEEMATAFGYQEVHGMLPVEHFMRELYGHLQNIAVVTDIFFEHVQEVLGLVGKNEEERQLERFVVVRGDTIRLTRIEALKERPYLLMRLFLLAGRSGYPLHHRTRQAISTSLELVDEPFRRSKKVARIFMELLVESREVFPVLESMLVCGLLPAYLPEFASIESLAQHDLYHLYTVDRHQLQTVAELHGLRQELGDLFAELRAPQLLYLAALLHDVGKGKQSDHSEQGAAMVTEIGKRIQLAEEEVELLSFLVRYHLFLPENALRRDLSDQHFIQQSAALIQDSQRLTMLYLLTIADSKATGPAAWSSWKSSLLSELYLQVKACLEAGCEQEDSAELGEEQGLVWLREQLEQGLARQGQAEIGVAALPGAYLLSFTPEEVLEHLALHKKHLGRLRQQVLLFPAAGADSWSLLIMSRDRSGLLAKLCGVLALHNLLVRSAKIFTWPDGTAVDVLEVSSLLERDFVDLDWAAVEQDCNRAINYRLDIAYKLHHKLQPIGMGRSRQVQQLERKIVIDNQISRQHTVIEVYGGDRYGTLYQLTQALADFKLDIHSARVATEVEQLIIVFYLTIAGAKLSDPALQARVEQTLLDIIGSKEEEPLLSA